MTQVKVDSAWDAVRASLSQGFDDRTTVDEFILMANQNILLEQIRDEIIKKRVPFENFVLSQVVPMELSCHSIMSSKILSEDESTIGGPKSKFAEEFQESLLECALQEIKSKCSEDTYEAVRKAADSYKKTLDFQALHKTLQKSRKQIEQLNHTNLTLHKQKSNTLWELNLLKPKVQTLEEEKQRVKKQLDYLCKKEAMLTQIETSFALKDKMNSEGRRRYSRQQETAINAQNKLDETTKEFWELWEKISKKCESVSCQDGCWKKNAMSKCKEQLLELRRALKIEQAQIEKEQEIMENLSSQFKKLMYNAENFIKENAALSDI